VVFFVVHTSMGESTTLTSQCSLVVREAKSHSMVYSEEEEKLLEEIWKNAPAQRPSELVSPPPLAADIAQCTELGPSSIGGQEGNTFTAFTVEETRMMRECQLQASPALLSTAADPPAKWLHEFSLSSSEGKNRDRKSATNLNGTAASSSESSILFESKQSEPDGSSLAVSMGPPPGGLTCSFLMLDDSRA